jgi:SAM-dependent methyltransferase
VERLSLDEARARQEESSLWVSAILRRLAPWTGDGRLRVLDVGAAQGRGLIALARLGHDAAGVEPAEDAIEVSRVLAQEAGLELDIRRASAEDLPFADDEFDLVLAASVMEHVDDLDRALREIRRVLKPGGVFWFNSASSVCPRQSEIRGFPLFGWYPLPVKRRVMWWAVRKRPELVGNTDRPALHWWTPRNARRRLAAAGFEYVADRWTLRHRDETRSSVHRFLLALARKHALVRLAGNVFVPGCAYLARRPDGE